MKKGLGILILGFFLQGCATPVGNNYSAKVSNDYEAITSMTPDGFTDNFMTGFTWGMYSPKHYDFYGYGNSKSEAIRKSEKKCREYASRKGWTNKVTCRLYVARLTTQPTYSSSSSSYSSYSSSSNSNPKPRLYYDSSSGGMRECSHDPGVTGNCYSFKTYKANNYDKDTLFYNPSTGAMQPCIGIVSVSGKCSAYGIFNHSKATADKGQLFYNPKTNKMTTCSHVTISGKCAHYDLVQNSWAKNDGGFRMSSSDNPYYKKVPQTSQDLIDVGMRMLSGNCTLGLDC